MGVWYSTTNWEQPNPCWSQLRQSSHQIYKPAEQLSQIAITEFWRTLTFCELQFEREVPKNSILWVFCHCISGAIETRPRILFYCQSYHNVHTNLLHLHYLKFQFVLTLFSLITSYLSRVMNSVKMSPSCFIAGKIYQKLPSLIWLYVYIFYLPYFTFYSILSLILFYKSMIL